MVVGPSVGDVPTEMNVIEEDEINMPVNELY